MRTSLCILALAAACGSAPPKPVPDSTREAVEPMPDAGARPANEPGGTAMGMADAGPEVLGAKADAGMATDGGAGLRDRLADAGAQIAGAASSVAGAAKEAGTQAATAAGKAAAEVSEALQKLPPAPPIPETPPFLPAVEESKD